MQKEFPAYDDFKMWVEDVRRTISLERSRRRFKVEALTVESVIEEVQELNDRLGAFQDIECRSLKAGLAELEYKNTGRVLLSDFYRAGLSGTFLFNEHVDFLRRLGALDESDSGHPSVIITNYLASQANCLASTSFHSVCCIDECEQLLGHLERSTAACSPSGCTTYTRWSAPTPMWRARRRLSARTSGWTSSAQTRSRLLPTSATS